MMQRHCLVAAIAAGLIAAPVLSAEPADDAYAARIAAAEKSLRLGETRELRRWLDACTPSRRGWEWHHLNAIADTAVRRVPTSGRPIRMEMSPTGDRVVVIDGTAAHVRRWPDLELVSSIDGHADAVYRASFSPDGTRLVTVARDVTARTWDVATGREIARIDLANPALASCAFDPSGTTCATCAWERDDDGRVHGVVWIWDAATGIVRHRRRLGEKPLSGIAYTPDGTRIITASWDGLIHVLDAEGAETRRISARSPDEDIYNAVDDLAISPDGRHVAAASKDRTVRVFEIETGAPVATLRGHGGQVQGVDFAPDGSHLASASVDATVIVWRTADWSRRAVLRGPTNTVRDVTWSAASDALTACSLDGRLWVWGADTNDTATTDIATGSDGIYSTTMSPDGAAVAVACFDGWLRQFDARTGAPGPSWEAHPGSTCHAAAYSADGTRLVTASWDRTARVWDPRDGSPVATLDAGRGVYAATITPDGTRVATSGGTIHLWDVASPTSARHEIAVDGAEPRRLAFSPDGARLASAWSDGLARVHEVRDGSLVATLGTSGAAVETVCFLDDGSAVATGDASGVVRAFPTGGGPARFVVDTGGRGVNQVACRGNRIAVATDRLWLLDAERGTIVARFTPQADTIWHLDWSPDGRRLATCAIAGLIRILER